MKKVESNEYIRKLQGDRVRECMKVCGLTGKEVAKKLNYTPQHISYILNGKRQLTKEMALDLAELFSKQLTLEPYSAVIRPSDSLWEDLRKEYIRRFGKEPANPIKITFSLIDRDYLLCKSDYMFIKDKITHSMEEEASFQFVQAVRSLLHDYDYDVLGYIPDLKFMDKDPDQFVAKYEYDKLYSSKFGEIIKISTGETVPISKVELFQLFHDFSDTIVKMTERKFKQKQWFETLNNVHKADDK